MVSKVPASLRVIARSAVDWWDGWLDMVVVISIWFFAQFTIILGPPATFGVYYVVENMVNGEALGLRGLIEGARKYFGKALLWGLINLLVIVTLSVNYVFYGGIQAVWSLSLQIFVLMLFVLWFTTNFYALPFFMEQDEKRLLLAFRNGLFMSLATPLYTLMLIIVVVLVVFLCTFMLPIFLGLPGLIAFLGFRGLNDRLIHFELRKPEKTPKEIEFDEGSKIVVPSIDRTSRDKAASSSSTGSEVSNGEGQVK